MPKKINKNELIELFKTVHGDKYDYSQFEYTSMRTESVIICRIHGGFRQIPHNHKNGKGCIICPEHGEFWQRPSAHRPSVWAASNVPIPN